MGQKRTPFTASLYVRFTPESGHSGYRTACPLSATSGHRLRGVSARGAGPPFTLALIALLLLVGELIVFWGFTAPVNRATENWTMLPGNWEELRAQWEYSHAARAFLYVLAMGTLVMSLLDWRVRTKNQ